MLPCRDLVPVRAALWALEGRQDPAGPGVHAWHTGAVLHRRQHLSISSRPHIIFKLFHCPYFFSLPALFEKLLIRFPNPDAAQRAAKRIREAAHKLQELPEIGRPVLDIDRPHLRDLFIPFGQAGYWMRYTVTDDYILGFDRNLSLFQS
jgi:plasmid stabilization system protein ParE